MEDDEGEENKQPKHDTAFFFSIQSGGWVLKHSLDSSWPITDKQPRNAEMASL